MSRRVIGASVVIAAFVATACTGKPAAPLSRSDSTAPDSRVAAPVRTISLDCSAPIDVVASPTGPHTNTLDAVGLDITSTVQVDRTGGTDPHRFFAKTGLLVHVGREATLTLPATWANRVAIAWGNHAPEWTNSLRIPVCPQPPGRTGQWLAFPGGFSVDQVACVPLEVRAGGKNTTVYVSVGTQCPGNKRS
jgi:hypothetical protein